VPTAAETADFIYQQLFCQSARVPVTAAETADFIFQQLFCQSARVPVTAAETADLSSNNSCFAIGSVDDY